MSTLDKFSMALAVLSALCGLALSTVLASSELLDWLEPGFLPDRVYMLIAFVGLFASPAVLPLVISSLPLGAATLATIRSRAQRRLFRVCAGLLGVVPPVFAVGMGVRLPVETQGTFTFAYYHHPLNFEPDLLMLCASDPASDLPRGAELGAGIFPPGPDPLMAAATPPSAGWPGGGPEQWPRVVSDSHGTTSYLVVANGRMVGPGNYGRPPYAHYRLDLDSVLSVTPLRPVEERCF